MKLFWHGGSTCTIKTDQSSLLLNPNDKQKEADIKVFSEELKERPSTHEKIFDWPGEYEAGGISWIGYEWKKKDEKRITLYHLEVEGVNLCYLHSLDSDLNEEMLKEIGDVDILFVPLGEMDSLSAKNAAKLVEHIEPRIVIPILYTDESLEEFKKELGASNIVAQKEFKVSKSNLPVEDMQVVILEQS